MQTLGEVREEPEGKAGVKMMMGCYVILTSLGSYPEANG